MPNVDNPHTTHFDDCGCKTKRLMELLTSAHEIIKKLEYSKPDYDGIRDECNFCNECEYTNKHSADCCVGKWLSDYERAIRGE